MTNKEKADILTMREKGLSYRVIGETLGFPINTVKSLCRRAEEKRGLCRNCGKPLTDVAQRATKQYCSDWCRRAWWKCHSDQTSQIPCYLKCQNCEQRFVCFGKAKRKYCSHPCYIAKRFGNDDEGLP